MAIFAVPYLASAIYVLCFSKTVQTMPVFGVIYYFFLLFFSALFCRKNSKTPFCAIFENIYKHFTLVFEIQCQTGFFCKIPKPNQFLNMRTVTVLN